MTRKKKTAIISILCGILLLGMIGCAYLYFIFFSPAIQNVQTSYIYIDQDDNVDSVLIKIKNIGQAAPMTGLKLLTRYDHFEKKLHTGRYELKPGDNMMKIYKELSRGQQTPMKLIIPPTRTMGQLVKAIDKQLMLDSIEVMKILTDTTAIQRLGFNEQTLPALFIPNTYECYWNISPEAFIKRLKQEYNKFWNEKRIQKANALGLSPIEVAILASIVDEETAKNDEKPIIAGLYINRLHKGMFLQADPTVKYSLNDPNIRRILLKHLEIDSPYNTYKYEGLPPGPIRIASVQGLESVLNPVHHNYLYMCAKEDFSGYHNFAETNAQHAANARRYQQALNQRGIR